MAATRRRILRNRRYNQELPRPRVFRDRLDPLAMADEDLFERYRFRRPTILYFLTKLEGDLIHPTARNMSLTAVVQILLFLRFLATGASHILIGDSFRVSRSAAGRAIREVAKLFCRHFRSFITFPTGEQSKRVMEGFRRIAGQHDGILLGDSAYACTRYLMTPYRTPTDDTQERYNDALCRTRVTIEQTYGILKKRFQALHYGLRTDPNQAAIYVHAAAILHNIGIEKGDIVIARNISAFSSTDISQDVQLQDRTDGRLRRDDISRGFFSV